ncbi:Purine nucleoside permease [Mycena indigotica]|uniref:Purine nucleoside permease n=1 Tax=Mycena indigotica TaxID=2126181 RepID=A0A8H6T366_9AGAR|nr:Purine nucleoside permease [Mycena indigotica]KAF7310054.1 Purine nucleoside permease [Mycena indigotica]
MSWLWSFLPAFLLQTFHPQLATNHNTVVLAPRVLIVNFFATEAAAWYNLPNLDLLAQNITLPGLSPLFPQVHCTNNGFICQVITGQAEINAATTITALVASPQFNLRSTYFVLSGIGGVSPEYATVGSVTLARFAVQVGLQHEIDAREKPADFPSGYFPQGAARPGVYPGWIDGTEVFEVNDALRRVAADLAGRGNLEDTEPVRDLRAPYAATPGFAKGAGPPSIELCDTLTSDTFWSGRLLAAAFEDYTRVITSGKAVPCSTQQEDNAVLAALLRRALDKTVNFARIVVIRAGSDFDRQYTGGNAADNLLEPMVGLPLAVLNLRIATLEVVNGIVDGWDATFEQGIEPTNYIGDILGSLGSKPDF